MSEIIDVTLFGLLAGLVTVVGGLIGVLMKKPGDRAMSAALGFAAGAMLTITFVGMIPQAMQLSMFAGIAGFALGVICLMFVDLKLPHIHIGDEDADRLVRVGVLIAVGIMIHDLPEGLAIGAGYVVVRGLGLQLALSIALHNAAEGFSIAVPLFAGGMKRSKVILITLVVGLPTALGAFLGSLVSFCVSPALLAGTLGFAAGAMLFITADELIPESQRHGHGHAATAGLAIGSILILVATQLIQ